LSHRQRPIRRLRDGSTTSGDGLPATAGRLRRGYRIRRRHVRHYRSAADTPKAFASGQPPLQLRVRTVCADRSHL
jgi:hypothetical protein